nr:tRNA-binding protein [Cytophagales bacterium]
MNNTSLPLTWEEFERVEMRVGTILEAEVFEAARRPAYKLLIDFGPLGVKKSSAQITDLYQPEDLIGRQVIGVVNFPPKQIATMKSECLILGAIGESKAVTLLSPERDVENGSRIG